MASELQTDLWCKKSARDLKQKRKDKNKRKQQNDAHTDGARKGGKGEACTDAVKHPSEDRDAARNT